MPRQLVVHLMSSNFLVRFFGGQVKGDKKDSRNVKPAESKEKSEESGSEDENADVSAATLDGATCQHENCVYIHLLDTCEVETFGRMMVLSPALLKKIPRQCEGQF